MQDLLIHFDLKNILLIVVLAGYLISRLLGFRIGPKTWTHWFWGESGDKKPTSATHR